MGGYSRKDPEFIWEHGGKVCAMCVTELDEDICEADDTLAGVTMDPQEGDLYFPSATTREQLPMARGSKV